MNVNVRLPLIVTVPLKVRSSALRNVGLRVTVKALPTVRAPPAVWIFTEDIVTALVPNAVSLPMAIVPPLALRVVVPE